MYEWNFELGLMVNLALIAGGYALCVTGPLRRFFPGNEPPTPVQVRLFFVGWVVLFIALASPIDSLGSYLLTMHMLQHLLLAMVAPRFCCWVCRAGFCVRSCASPARTPSVRFLPIRSSSSSLLMRFSRSGTCRSTTIWHCG